jgi:hypothetical protein
MPALDPVGAGPATSGPREPVDVAPAPAGRVVAGTGRGRVAGLMGSRTVEGSPDAHGAGRPARWAVTGSVG